MEKIWIKEGKFNLLSIKEVDTLSEEEIKEYSEAKSEFEKEQIINDVKEITKDLMKKEDFDKFLDGLQKEEDFEAFKNQVNEKLENLSKTIIEDIGEKEVGFEAALKSAWEGMKKRFKDDPNINSAEMSIKALPMTTTTWSASSNYPFLQDDQESGIAKAPITPLTFVQDVQTLAPISPNSDKWTWIERGTVTDGTNSDVAENGAFGVVEVAYNKQETSVKKIANYTKITREMLEDWNEFSMAVNELVNELLLTTLNDDLFTAIQGISVEFDANGLTTSTPSVWDVIRVTIAQIMSSGKTKWIPNKIYMNPIDVAEQDIDKDSNGNYIFPPFIMPNGMQVKGIVISETTDIDVGYFEIADMKKVAKRFKRAIDIRVWEQNATDVQNDLLTITGSLRYASRIKTVDYSAFVYDSFDAAIAILTSAAASLILIQAMATGSDASKLTINLLIAAGVTGTDPADLGAYKTAVAGETSIANLAALQTLINAV